MPLLRPSLLILTLVLGLAAGCSAPLSEAELLARAKAAMQRHEFRAAYLDLQSALQQNDRSSELRFTLGRLLAEAGDHRLAVVELRKALGLGHPRDQVVPLLARSMFKASQTRELLQEFGQETLSDPVADADLKTSIAGAMILQGRRDEARPLLESVMARAPQHAPSRILAAQQAADAGDPDAAMRLLDELVAREPGNSEAWRVRGDVLQVARRDGNAALESYDKALQANPANLEANRALIFLLLARGEVDAAEKRLARMRELFPGDVQVAYFTAHIKTVRGQVKEAATILEQVRKVAPNDRWVLFLGGVIDLSQRSWVQAEQQLSKLLRQHPEFAYARLLLARLALQTGEPNQAMEVLQPLLAAKATASAQVLTLAGEAQLMLGRGAEASRLFDAAAASGGTSEEARMGKARAALARGDVDAAAQELVRLAAVDKGNVADLALISLQLKQGQLDAAAKSIESLVAKRPDDPLGHKLKAELALRQGREAEARAAFEQCLKLEPRFFDAAAGLAAMDLKAGRKDEAEARLKALAEGDKGLLAAKLALASMRQLSGDREGARTMLREAVARHPEDTRSHLALADLLLSGDEARPAQQALLEAERTLPGSSQILLKLAQAQIANRDLEQAMATYGKILSLRPNLLPALQGLGDLQSVRKDHAGAATTFRRVLQLQPDALPALSGLVRAEVAQSRYDAAQAAVNAFIARHPDSAVGPMALGDIDIARGRGPSAAERYAQAVARPDATSALAVHAYDNLRAAGQGERAKALADGWMRKRPQDADFLVALADVAARYRDVKTAEARYREALALKPQHLGALNNLAWLLATENKAGGVALAEAALKLRPDSPQILDTLAQALATEGQIARAIEIQRTAAEKAPRFTPDFHLSLARLYLRSGDLDRARDELQRLQSLGKAYARHAEVAQLLKAAGP